MIGDVVAPSKDYYLEDGVWWQRLRSGARTRAILGTCDFCGREFVSWPDVRRIKLHCSRECYHSCTRAGNHLPFPKGSISSAAARWKGGKIVRRGYVFVHLPDHHSIVNTPNRKYVAEHRLVMEEKLGRNMESYETVHHINGVRDDNRPENLELWSKRSQPAGQRNGEAQHCPTCTCGHAQTIEVPSG